MPGSDKTGPLGAGPGTGWGLGRCTVAARRGIAALGGILRGVGRGGMPRGGGRGLCFGGARFRGESSPFPGGPSVTPAKEAEILRAELAAAKEQLAAMQVRLEELEKQNPSL
ncbi:MAG: DUF5320 domain-containing protein [Desulfomonile tiedjei]|nr:DUF5320 domain-containing protein [Desulfomonile tiedjei]